MALEELAAAQEAFYDALDAVFRGDPAPMQAIWSHADDVTQMGPMGDLVVGWGPIEAGWVAQSKVVEGGTVRPHDVHLFASGDLGAAVGLERGHVVIGGTRSEVKARSTNLFRREGGSWRLIGHHVDPHVPDHAEKA